MSGGYAYVVGIDDLRVIDVTTPSDPVEVGSAIIPSLSWGIAVSTGIAYVAWADDFSAPAGLRAFDVTWPSAPVEIGSYDTPGEQLDVTVADGHVFLTSDGAGLYIFEGCGLFADGFESGDTSAWSATVP